MLHLVGIPGDIAGGYAGQQLAFDRSARRLQRADEIRLPIAVGDNESDVAHLSVWHKVGRVEFKSGGVLVPAILTFRLAAAIRLTAELQRMNVGEDTYRLADNLGAARGPLQLRAIEPTDEGDAG